VPAGLGLAVNRIAQEALTNVVRHAGVDRARLRHEADDEGLSLIVINGPASTPVDPVVEGGHGIQGMRERAGLYGGTLSAGLGDDGGFQVNAHFPVLGGDA
jgi:signal transduction histidine kinase